MTLMPVSKTSVLGSRSLKAGAGWWMARSIERRASARHRQLFSNQYFQGLNYLLNEQPDKAIQVFERLIFAEPTYPQIVEARMYLARAYYNKGEFITSVSEFTRVLDRHPGHPLAPDASLVVVKAFGAAGEGTYAELWPVFW